MDCSSIGLTSSDRVTFSHEHTVGQVDEEEPLAGGNASGPVVRVGGTVRKPWTAASAHVAEFVSHLRAAGVDAPVPLGRDEQGRQITEFVPGRRALDAPPLTLGELGRVGALVRAIHDASADFAPGRDAVWETLLPPPDASVICHNDLAPWNLLIGERWVFIDWDGAGPSSALWDLAYAAQSFTLNDVTAPPHEAARGLAAFVDGYGASARMRELLPRAMHERAAAMHELLRSAHETGREPWGTMYASGHGAHWEAVTRYVAAHQSVWRAAIA
ncbi:trifolitoxin immunity domain-containing protein [Leifsonia sp. LS1]|nr:trifolitoxin immunity domain-containing protein [Leifsonia sp. LS1]